MPAGRLGFWQGVHGRIAGAAAIDWAALETELRAELSLMIRLRDRRDRLMLAVIGNLGRVDLSAVAQVADAIHSLPKPNDFRLSPFLDGLRRQLESTADRLETWTPTEEEIRRMVRSLVDRLLGYIEQSPLGQLRILLIDFQQRIVGAIEELPFRDLAHEAETALRSLAGSMEVIDPGILREPVRVFFADIESGLDAFSGEAVGNAMNTLWSGVEDTLNQINTQIDTLRTTIEGLAGQLQTMTESVQPALETITQSVSTISTMLAEFDLTEPADAVVESLHELRDTVADLDVSALPGTAVSALKAGAEFLRGIDLAGTVNPPLNDALAQVDPTSLIAEAAEKISGVTARLKLLDPAALSRKLDAPVDELLSALSQVGPEQFTRLLEEALKPVEDAVRAIDLGQLLAPVTRLFAEISAKVDAVLNPDVIFGPLEELFKPVEDLIDGLAPARFIDQLQPHGDGFAEKVGSAAGPPAQVAAAGLRDAIPAGPESEEELFGF
ncbi:MAG TPA: hypothetical protein VLT88_04595, partial [Desulfosarcina sp.]|nr:hypothetical protein [Desulfosarcina sp.]